MDKLNNVLQTVREDDFVEYFLFPLVEIDKEKEQQLLVQTLLIEANKVIHKYSQEYLWHKDPIRLTVRTQLSNVLTHIEGTDEHLPPHLHGVTHYGDNIEDEWFIVFLLQEITKVIPGVIARVYDSDGEFVLIEAAEFLPSWANPEVCQNRVYFYEGMIHLLPFAECDSKYIRVEDALQRVRSVVESTEGSTDIQNCIRNRLSVFPNNIRSNQHFATVYVPTAVAVILKASPGLISAAVQAFCNRDTIDMKSCRAMKYFPPEQRVRTRVKFTRCQYAMMLHSKYLPERRIGWNLPPATSKDYQSQLLGVKVACGFEILAAQARPGEDVEGDRGWANYLDSLKERGYFGEFLEGSREYCSRMESAKQYYREHRDSMHYSPALGQEVLRLLHSCEIDMDVLTKEADALPEDDDDTWLDVSPEELEKMLQERYGQRKYLKVDEATDPGNFAQKINSFLTRVSDIEGAEFPEEVPEVPQRKKKGVSFEQDVNDNPKVDFDPDGFANAVQNMLNFVIPEDDSWDLESDSDMSQYEHEECAGEENLGDQSKMREYMRQMDAELAGTTVGQSFEKREKREKGFEDVEEFKPVDIDMNALKNILESYRAQMGDAGPSSNMLGPMGVHLDPK